MAITTENYLKDLIKQKENLVSTLQDCGVEASKDEKFNTLVPKVKGLAGNLIFKGTIADELEIEGNLSHDAIISILNSLKNLSIQNMITKQYDYASVTNTFQGDPSTYTFDVKSASLNGTTLTCSVFLEALNENCTITIYNVTNITEDDLSNIKSIYYPMDHVHEEFGYPVVTTVEINIVKYIVSETKTLTLGATNLAKLTDEEKALAINKGWNLL
jgi:hypothetical protein